MKTSDTVKIVGIMGFFLLAVVGIFMGFNRFAVTNDGADGEGTIDDPVVTQGLVDIGLASTLYLDAYDEESDSDTEVFPEYYVIDSQGNKIVDGSATNSTTTVVGEEVDIYGSDEDASYYVDPRFNFKVTSAGPVVRLDAHKIVTVTNMATIVYDDTMTALTEETHSNKTATIDYTGGDYGSDECNTWSVKLKNGEANSLFRLGAICTGWGGDVDDFELLDNDWEEIDILPEELDDTTISVGTDADGTLSIGNWKKCYVPKSVEYFDFAEWDSEFYDFKVCAASTAPADNTGDTTHLIFLDYGYEKGKDKNMYGDFYVHDDDEEPSDVGLDESTYIAGPDGGYIAVTVELV